MLMLHMQKSITMQKRFYQIINKQHWILFYFMIVKKLSFFPHRSHRNWKYLVFEAFSLNLDTSFLWIIKLLTPLEFDTNSKSPFTFARLTPDTQLIRCRVRFVAHQFNDTFFESSGLLGLLQGKHSCFPIHKRQEGRRASCAVYAVERGNYICIMASRFREIRSTFYTGFRSYKSDSILCLAGLIFAAN